MNLSPTALIQANSLPNGRFNSAKRCYRQGFHKEDENYASHGIITQLEMRTNRLVQVTRSGRLPQYVMETA